VLAFAALRPVERRGDVLWVTGRPGGDEGAAARARIAALAERRIGRMTFLLDALGPPARPGEAILRVRGPGAHDALTDTDPFLRDLHPVMRPQALVPEAGPAAAAAEGWSRLALGEGHAVTLKWWGRRRPAPTFRARHGLDGVLIGASPFLAGLAAALGLRFGACPEGDDPAEALRARLDLARAALDEGATFALCHLKATDEAGHTKDPAAKRRAIERADAALEELAERFPEAVVAVTGDHATPPAPAVIHSGDPVPLLVRGPGVRADRVHSFGEEPFADGMLGRIAGADLMPVLLNAADRPLFLGSRPTPVPGAMGVPCDVEPLRP
jgi:2,3-bisphosphoglycerate-independent phosphoglycerate mutase